MVVSLSWQGRLCQPAAMSESATQTITTEARGHVFLMGLNRPHKRNAFNLDMLRELSQAYAAYEDDPQARCAVLFAHGDHFTAGLDLAEVGPAVASGKPLFPEDGIDPVGMAPYQGGRKRTKPVIMAVQGWCLTVGMELIMASDMCVAAENTRFAQIEIKRGIMPFGGATLRFPLIAGWGNAMRYLLTGDELGAAEAHRIGLVQEVVTTGTELGRAIALAEAVARQAPLAVQASLVSARVALEQGPAAAADKLLEQTRGLMRSEDAMEGVRSFIERREAVFKGK